MSGARCFGDNNGNCKYSDDVVVKVREMRRLGASYMEISEMTGIPYSTVNDMINKRKTAADREKEAK